MADEDLLNIETLLKLRSYIWTAMYNATNLVPKYCIPIDDYATLNRPLSEAWHLIQALLPATYQEVEFDDEGKPLP